MPRRIVSKNERELVFDSIRIVTLGEWLKEDD